MFFFFWLWLLESRTPGGLLVADSIKFEVGHVDAKCQLS